MLLHTEYIIVCTQYIIYTRVQFLLSTTGSVFLNGSHFRPNYDLPIISISCGVEDNNISQCVHSIFNQSGACNHRNEIGIVCQGMANYWVMLLSIN